MGNEKPDSRTSRKNFPKLAGLVASAVLLIALAYIYQLNGFGETFQAKSTATPRASATSTATHPPPTSTPSETPTTPPSSTPEPSYNCPLNPDASRVEVHFLEDIKSGKLAEWAIRQAKGKTISASPTTLHFYTDSSGIGPYHIHALNAHNSVGPQPWFTARAVIPVGLCSFDPNELGFDKDPVYLIISVTEDKLGTRAGQITLATPEMVNDLRNKGYFDPSNKGREIVPADIRLGYIDKDVVEDDAKPGSRRDFRDLVSPKFLDAQQVTFKDGQGKVLDGQDAIVAAFTETAENGTFSSQMQAIMNTTILQTIAGINYNP